MGIKIFSYGTLQKSKFTRGKEVKPGTLTGAYEIMSGDFPLLQEMHKGTNVINGLLFEVSQDEIDEIDDYENMPHFFKRQEKQIVLEDGKKETAWVYLLNEQIG
ncbi:gamma-glutamylcyclotransferase family protein [Sulfurimonas sp.]|uniref:gamma-glutamylcyclotransferase family protein n=1 Tax=Sulfurimonas sp. TaxID=2022749 RepID=UPI003566193F